LGFIIPQHGFAGGGWKRSLRELPKNPLILACVLGMSLSLLAPKCLQENVVGSSLKLVASSALPLALLVTGAALDVQRIRAAPVLLTLAALGKLVFAPAITVLLAWCFGAGPAGMAAATILMACPTAVANTPMARQLGGDEALMAAQVVLTTILCPISLIAWMVLVI
jgi:predicted permease